MEGNRTYIIDPDVAAVAARWGNDLYMTALWDPRAGIVGSRWDDPDFWAAAVLESFILWLIYRAAHKRHALKTASRDRKGYGNILPEPAREGGWPSNPADVLFASSSRALPKLVLHRTRNLRRFANIVTIVAIAATLAPLGIAFVSRQPGLAGLSVGLMFLFGIVGGCLSWLLAMVVRMKIRMEIATALESDGLTCLVCGYDLRELPALSKCPECGSNSCPDTVRDGWKKAGRLYGVYLPS